MNLRNKIFGLIVSSAFGFGSLFASGQTPPEKLWELEIGVSETSPAVGSDGTIYVAAGDNFRSQNQFIAVNPDGSKKWSIPGRFSTPAIGKDGTIYTASSGLRALNPDSSEKWHFPAVQELSVQAGPSIAEDGTIYFRDFGQPVARLYAVKPDGTKKWELAIGPLMMTSPSISHDGIIYVITSAGFRSDNKLCAVVPDGTLKWTFPLTGFIGSSPTIGEDGTIYFGYDKHLYALRPDGTKKWDFFIEQASSSSPAIGLDGTIYVGSSGLYAINPDGTLKWRFNKIERVDIRSSPAISADGTIYFNANDKFYALNPDGSELWSMAAGGISSPAITADGRIYFGSFARVLHALQGAAGLMNSPWPMTGHDLQHSGRAGGLNVLRISQQPQSQTKSEGSSVWFSVQAISLDTLEYQWRHNSIPIDGARGSSHTIRFARPADAGNYDVIVRHSKGSATSAAALLTISSSEQFVERRLPEGFYLGNQVEVILSAMPKANILVYAVEDQPPAGWTVGMISHEGVYDPQTGKLKFGPFHDHEPRGLSYQLTPPERGDSIVNLFAGTGSIEGVPSAIQGDDSISFAAVFHPADLRPADNAITVDEVTGYSFAWRTGERWPLPPYLISEEFVARAGTLWRGGERYVYDHTKEPEVLRWLNPSGPVTTSLDVAGQNAAASTPLDSVTGAAVGSLPRPGQILWEANIASEPSSPALAPDGTIYVGIADTFSTGNRLFTFRADGTTKWSSLNGFSPAQSPAVATDGTIYVGRGNPINSLEAYNPDGSQLWFFKTGHFIRATPALGRDGTVYFGSADRKFYAVNKDGTKRWEMNVGMPTSAAIASDDTIYFASDETPPVTQSIPGKLYAVRADGSISWTTSVGLGSPCAPIVSDDGTIYLLFRQALYAISPEGKEKWKFDLDLVAAGSGPSIGTDGTIYFGAGNVLFAVNPVGTEKWRFAAAAAVVSTPAIAGNGTIYFQSLTRSYAIGADGREQWSLDFGGLGSASPVLSKEGIVYFASSQRKKLYAVYGGSGLAQSPWPMVGHDAQHSGRAGGATSLRIINHPQSQSVPAGTNITVSASATGDEPLFFQWQQNGTNIAGATNSTFTIRIVRSLHAGTYHAVISNSKGSGVSAGAVLTVESSISFVERKFPSAFYAGDRFEVALSASPLPGVEAYAVEEKPPAGWTVISVSADGVYDSQTKKVKFGPFFDRERRELKYELSPPQGGEAAQNEFAGAASADGVSSSIRGSASINLQSLLHPADVNPADNAIKIDEAAAYAAAWRNGESWRIAPNPIPIDYVTRAGTLWKRGEHYVYDATKKDEALRWLNPLNQSAAPANENSLATKSLRSFSQPEAGAGLSGAAYRSLPSDYVPGQKHAVQIDAKPSGEVSTYALQDRPPDQWIVFEINHDGVFDASSGLIKWGPFYDNQPRTLRYWLMPMQGVVGRAQISGLASYDGLRVDIGGEAVMHPAPKLAVAGWGTDGIFRLQLSGASGKAYWIAVSEDLSTWKELATVIGVEGILTVEDSSASQFKQRFYRLIAGDRQ